MTERIGNDAAIRANVPGKCKECMWLMGLCNSVVVTKTWRGGKLVIIDCNDYTPEPLSVRSMQEWRNAHGDSAPPLTYEDFQRQVPKLF